MDSQKKFYMELSEKKSHIEKSQSRKKVFTTKYFDALRELYKNPSPADNAQGKC